MTTKITSFPSLHSDQGHGLTKVGSPQEKQQIAKQKNRKTPLSKDMVSAIFDNLPSNPNLTQIRDSLIPIFAYHLLLRHDEVAHINLNHIFTFRAMRVK